MPDYRAIARQKARQYGVPEEIFLRQIDAESHFDPNAHSSAGADGIAQFIPSTARSYGLTNTRDPLASLDAAARYDRDLLHRYGTIDRALSAYNSGKPDAYLDPNFADGQTYNYVRSILKGRTPAPATPTPTVAPATAAPPTSTSSPLDPLLLQLFSNNAQTVGVPSLAPLLALALSGGRPPTPMPTAAADPVSGGGGGGQPQHGAGGKGLKFLAPEAGVDLSRVNSKLLDAANQLGAFLGKTITVASGYRDRAKQAALYQRYVNSGYDRRYIAAKPGTSNHEHGDALDLLIDGVPIHNAVPAATLARFGLHNSVPGDLPHTTLLTVKG